MQKSSVFGFLSSVGWLMFLGGIYYDAPGYIKGISLLMLITGYLFVFFEIQPKTIYPINKPWMPHYNRIKHLTVGTGGVFFIALVVSDIKMAAGFLLIAGIPVAFNNYVSDKAIERERYLRSNVIKELMANRALLNKKSWPAAINEFYSNLLMIRFDPDWFKLDKFVSGLPDDFKKISEQTIADLAAELSKGENQLFEYINSREWSASKEEIKESFRRILQISSHAEYSYSPF